MGFPAYGYDWDLTAKHYAKTTTTVFGNQLGSYNASWMHPVWHWNAESETPYLSYTARNGHRHEIWIENDASLKLKVDLAKQANVGVSVWSLGQGAPWYWSTLYYD